MQKKQRHDKNNDGQHHSPPIASTPRENDIEEESDTELKHKVSRICFGVSKRKLSDKSLRKLSLLPLRTKM